MTPTSSGIASPAATEKEIISVAELNRRVKRTIESQFAFVWVEGEISNFSRPASGHWYFTLKDANAQVRCAMFRNRNQRLKEVPANGDQIIARAKVSLYEGRGDYQLIVEHIEPAGDGALLKAFERLKKKLAAEGLFEPERKRALPAHARHIGVITSPSGAAVRDILAVLKRRFPATEVTIIPAAVQGAGAAQEIRRGIYLANRVASDLEPAMDVLVVARGGGSLEDLQAFNDEGLARDIFSSELPIVSAIGHEVDFTIADFVADARAPTPSAAAELLSPDQQEWQMQLQGLELRLAQQLRQTLAQAQQRLDWLRKRMRHPGQRLQEQAQRLDNLELHLKKAIHYRLMLNQNRLQDLKVRVQLQSPVHAMDAAWLTLKSLSRRLDSQMKNLLEQKTVRLHNATQLLETVSPLATLNRGYSILSDQNNAIIRDSEQVDVGDEISARLSKGNLTCVVKSR